MKKRSQICFVLVLSLVGSVSAQDPWEVPCADSIIGSTKTVGAGETFNVVCGQNRFHVGQCTAGGGELTVNGGTVTVDCLDRFVIENGGQITMNDGEMTITVTMAEDDSLMMSDNCGPSYMNLNGGTITLNGSFDAECDPGRAAHILVGCGQFRCTQDWKTLWDCVGDTPIESVPGHEPWQYYQEGGYWVLTGSNCDQPQVCACLADLNEDEQIDLEDLQALAGILLEAGSPFVVEVEPGHCADLNVDEQIDLEDLQAVAGILLDAGSPFVAQCD